MTDQQFVCDMAPDGSAEMVQRALARTELSAATLRSGIARDKEELLAKLVSRIDPQGRASISPLTGRCRRRLGKLAALGYLAPDIVNAIIEG